jgi:hypothetical protein
VRRASWLLAIVALLVAMATAGCTPHVAKPKGAKAVRPGSDLVPTFQPEAPSASTPAPATTAVPGRGPSPTTATTARAGAVGTTIPPVGPPTMAAFTDPAGDVTPSPLDPPPPWADLLGATLRRSSAGYELRVRLGGGQAPAHTTDDQHSMNIASFYDVDGNGSIDYQVWANLADDGWGPAWFDDATPQGRNKFGAASGVVVAVEGDEVVFRFPLDHLGGAARLRWSIASEWGTYTTLSTPAAARDSAPDAGPAPFPGP